jgi:Lamin-B receptor of TUDOR domain
LHTQPQCINANSAWLAQFSTDAMHMQAAYNNTSQIELENSDIQTVDEAAASSLHPIGTKVAKQFDAAGGELVWFEGVVQRYDEEDGLYWVLYNDGDSEDLDETEFRDAVHNYRVHVL